MDGEALVMNAVFCPFDAVLRKVLADFFDGEGHAATAAALRGERGEDLVRMVYGVCDRIGRRPDPFAVRAVAEILIPLQDAEDARREEERQRVRRAYEEMLVDRRGGGPVTLPDAEPVHVG